MDQQGIKKHGTRRIVIILLILIALAGIVFSVVKKTPKNEEIVKEETKEEIFVLRQEPVFEEMEFFGNLQAKRESLLAAKTSGRISTINVEEGDAVKSGQLLAFLHLDQYGIDYQKKSENYQNFETYRKDEGSYWDKQVKIAEENLEVKKENKEYYEMNDSSRVEIAEDEVDKAEEELKLAKRQRDAQKDSLWQQSQGLNSDKDTSAQSVTDTRIFAPYKGVVLTKFLEVGEVVGAGQTVVSVADVSAFKVVVEVPDTMIDRLSTGLSARVNLDGIPGDFNATVTNVNPSVDPVAKKIEVEVTLDSAPQNAKVDMFARVYIAFPSRTTYFVPNNFVYAGFEGPFVLTEDGKQQSVRRLGEADKKTEIAFDGIADGIRIKRDPDGKWQSEK